MIWTARAAVLALPSARRRGANPLLNYPCDEIKERLRAPCSDCLCSCSGPGWLQGCADIFEAGRLLFLARQVRRSDPQLPQGDPEGTIVRGRLLQERTIGTEREQGCGGIGGSTKSRPIDAGQRSGKNRTYESAAERLYRRPAASQVCLRPDGAL